MSKDLTARVRLDTKQAVKSLDSLEKKINRINNLVNKNANNSNGLNRELEKSARQSKQVADNLQRSDNNGQKLNHTMRKTGTVMDSLVRKVKQLAAAYLGVMGARAFVDTSDTITSSMNKLNTINEGDVSATQLDMDKMYTSAQRVRMSYTDMMSNVSKSMALAGDSFDNNIDNAIRFQEIMAEAYTLGGASAAEQSSSMYQMMQALGSGILQGDELRSVREGAPLAYKAIEEFCQGVLDSEESLKELASQGLVTSDMVVAAIMNAGAKFDEQFENTYMTFGQLWNKIKNTAVKAFEPVFAVFRELLNSDEMQKFVDILTQGMLILSRVLTVVATAFANFFKWFVNNWDWIRYIVLAVVTALIIHLGLLAIKAVVTGITMFISFLMGLHPIYLIIIAIGILVGALVWLANTAVSGCEFICYALLIVATLLILVGVIAGIAAFWWLGIILAVVAIVLAVFTEFGSQIMGGIYVVGSFIGNVVQLVGNLFVTLGGLIVATFYNAFAFVVNLAMGLWNSICAIAQNIGIAFENGWIHATNAFWSFIEACLRGIKWLEPAINAVAKAFGAEGFSLSGVIDNVAGRQRSTKSYVSVSDAFSSGYSTMDFMSYGDVIDNGMNAFGTAFEDGWASNAYNKGSAVGADWQNKLEGFGSNLKDKFGSLGDGTLIDKLGGFGEFGATDFDALNNTLVGADPSAIIDPTGGNALGGNGLGGSGNGGSGTGKDISDIADNTEAIADSMALTQDDLEYLRKIAALEWKKEYTTANITVDMKNYNTVEGDGDLDGIVTKLVTKLYEELDEVANGVYA